MSFELFEQGPSVYIPILLISALITAAAYSVFPMSFANVRRRGISTKKYRVLCYVFNFFVMMFFVALNGSSSGVPYFLWTSVFISFGLKKLERRCILVDSKSPELPTTLECHKVEKTPAQHQPTKDEQQPIHINLSQEGEAPKKYGNYAIPANELMLEVRTVEETPRPVQNVPITQDDNEKHTITRSQLKDTAVLMGLSYTETLMRINYERHLQEKPPLILVEDVSITQSEPERSNPSKQYSKIPTVTNKTFVVTVVAILSFLIVGLCILKINQLNTHIDGLETELTLAEQTLSNQKDYEVLKTKVSIMEQVYDFCNSYVVVVSDDGSRNYHKCDCPYFDITHFWAYNTELAEQHGYRPCSYCFDPSSYYNIRKKYLG